MSKFFLLLLFVNTQKVTQHVPPSVRLLSLAPPLSSPPFADSLQHVHFLLCERHRLLHLDKALEVHPLPLGVQLLTIRALARHTHPLEPIRRTHLCVIVSAVVARLKQDRVADGFVASGVAMDEAALGALKKVFFQKPIAHTFCILFYLYPHSLIFFSYFPLLCI